MTIICSPRWDLEELGQIILLAKHCRIQSCTDLLKWEKNALVDLVNYMDFSTLLRDGSTSSATENFGSCVASKAFNILPFLIKSFLVHYLLGNCFIS